MGQQSSQAAELNRQQNQLQELTARLQRVDELIAAPDQLERESNLQFQRAPLDSHGCMRRIELRRLLWTFAHHLGSEDLTWEAIEVAAVVGTIEPNVSVVTQAEFFRCVYKTVHLVSAELRKRLEKLKLGLLPSEGQEHDMKAQQRQIRSHIPTQPPVTGGVESGDESGQDEEDDEDEPLPPGSGPIEVPLFLPAPGSPPPPIVEPVVEAFDPAPGGNGDDTLLVNGMMAMTLSVEGTFDPQRVSISNGHLVIRDAEEHSKGHGLDLRDLVTATTGKPIAQSPFRNLIPGWVNLESLDRMLVLEFDDDEVVTLWFPSPEDCSLCLKALTEEAERALEASRQNGSRAANSAVKWVTGFFGTQGSNQPDDSAT